MPDVVTTVVPKRDYGKKTEIHHIVAKSDWRAKESRRILGEAEIGIDSDLNKVAIDKKYHRVLHTDLYHKSVEAALSNALHKGGKAAVKNELRNINILLGKMFGG